MKNKKYHCSYCRKEYDDINDADKCRLSHDLRYITISSDDLNKLINFLYIGERELLTPSLMRSLKQGR